MDPHKAKIDALPARYPELLAVRIREEIARGPAGYTGSAIVVCRYLRTVRPAREASVAVTQDLCGRFAVASLNLLNHGHIEA